MRRHQVRSKGHFIEGAWREEGAEFENRSPQDLDHVVGVFREGDGLVDDAVQAANRALPVWRGTPVEERIAIVEAFGRELAGRERAIADAIVAETGKTLRWALVEARALPGKIAISADLARAALGRRNVGGANGYVVRRPLGVFAVVGPFNFPVHLSNGHIVPALMAGNTVVLKPSETAPACAQIYAEAWEAAASASGADPSVLQLVQGEGATGARLVGHDDVHGVAFTGSYEVGVAIRRQTAHQTSKLLALEMGGKNTAIVLSDADLERAASDIAEAAYVMSGQRCTATSRVVVASSRVDAFVARLAEHVRGLTVGDPFGEFDLGPLSTLRARSAYDDWQGRRAGLETIVEPTLPPALPRGCWAAPCLHRVVDRELARERDRTELFGPEVLVHSVDDLDAAIQLANATPYGLAMSVHCAEESTFESVRSRLEAGLINWNRGTAGASSQLPFGGIKQSGNHRPAGASAIDYMTHPVSVLRGRLV